MAQGQSRSHRTSPKSRSLQTSQSLVARKGSSRPQHEQTLAETGPTLTLVAVPTCNIWGPVGCTVFSSIYCSRACLEFAWNEWEWR